MTSLYVKLIVRAIMNFPGSHGYSIIKNLLALPIIRLAGLTSAGSFAHNYFICVNLWPANRARSEY